jgi:hypothetical protein
MFTNPVGNAGLEREGKSGKEIERCVISSFQVAQSLGFNGEFRQWERRLGGACSDQYCTRYMVGTRGKSEPITSANHAGFRCVKSGDLSVATEPMNTHGISRLENQRRDRINQ